MNFPYPEHNAIDINVIKEVDRKEWGNDQIQVSMKVSPIWPHVWFVHITHLYEPTRIRQFDYKHDAKVCFNKILNRYNLTKQFVADLGLESV